MILKDFLPITVVCAVLIFLLKEILDVFKKKTERQRKISAYKLLILEELRKNAWSVKHLKGVMSELSDPDLKSVKISKLSSGGLKIAIHTEGSWGSSPLWPIHTSVFEKIFIGLAETDAEIFSAVSQAYEDLAEVKHVRDSLIEFSESPDHPGGWESFAEYGEDVIKDCEAAMNKLCTQITGKPLEGFKLRSYI